MAIGIDPTVDFAFKRLLGSPEHARLTVHFLNAVLGGSPRITEVKILNPFLPKEFEEDKLSVLDVKATDEHGRHLNVEMQTSLPAGMRQRLAYYASRLYVDQLSEGVEYAALRPAICICVLDATMFANLPDLHLDFRLREAQHPETLTDDLQIHTIELPKYVRPADNVRISDPLEEWVYFLRFADASTAGELAATLADDEFIEAMGVLEMIAKSPDDRALYEARLKFQRDAAARMQYAQEEAMAKGIEKGIEKGRVQGVIRTLQQELGVTESTDEELNAMGLSELEAVVADLRALRRDRD